MSLYDTDLHAWAFDTADKIRRGEMDGMDWESVAEEIESLGKGARNKLQSLLEIVLLHLLQWDHQPTRRGTSWQLTLVEHRKRLARHLEENPSLKPDLPSIFSEAYTYARLRAARETGHAIETLPPSSPYSIDQAFSEDFLPVDGPADA